MADLAILRAQEYSTNLELLAQQMTPKLANFARIQPATGNKAFRMLSQVGSASAVKLQTSAVPAMNLDISHDGRWVYPVPYAWGTVVDDIELLQTNITPQGAYTRAGLASVNRRMDEEFLAAFFGNSQTGETGGTATAFPAAQQVAATVGASANTGLNVEKLRAAKRILLEREVNLDMESIYASISPLQHDNLLALTQVVSTDFNERPVLGQDGMVTRFLGINFVISNLLPTDANSLRRIPVWVPSGMGRGDWKALTGTIRKRSDLQLEPDYVEVTATFGFTRLEEAKCVEIKCSE